MDIERLRYLKRKDYWKHREKRLSTHKKYRDRLKKEEPWIPKFWSIKQRCEDMGCGGYPSYGARGIKCLITKEELKKLWFRDKAWLLKKASIDRINNQGNYTFENCRFIELVENNRRKRKVTQLDRVREYLIENKQGTLKQLCEYAQAVNITSRISDLKKEGFDIRFHRGTYTLA